jgi:hypothetical protein
MGRKIGDDARAIGSVHVEVGFSRRVGDLPEIHRN